MIREEQSTIQLAEGDCYKPTVSECILVFWWFVEEASLQPFPSKTPSFYGNSMGFTKL